MQHFLNHAGYGALVLLAFIEACCIPIPSEATFGLAGVLASEGRLNLALVILLGSIAELAGSYVAWAVGYRGGRRLVERFGRLVLIGPRDIARAESWLTRRGVVALPLGRATPAIRAFVSVVAGMGRMSAVRFGVLSFIGTACYVAVVSVLGYELGSTWQRVEHAFSIAGIIVAAVAVAAIAVVLVRRWRTLRLEQAAEL